MSEAKHTPGPWFAVLAQDDEGVLIPRVASPLTSKRRLNDAEGDAHTFVCETFSDGFQDEDQDIANARLIAAAPDLLLVSMLLVDLLKMDFECNQEREYHFNDLLSIAEQAISKAEGRDA